MAKTSRKVNCITPELYAEIKNKLKSPSDDKKVMGEYGIGASTCRSIRNTNSYEEYRSRVADKRKAMRQLDKLTETAKYDRVVKHTTAPAPKVEDKPSATARFVGLFLLVCVLAIIGGVTLAVLRWAFGF